MKNELYILFLLSFHFYKEQIAVLCKYFVLTAPQNWFFSYDLLLFSTSSFILLFYTLRVDTSPFFESPTLFMCLRLPASNPCQRGFSLSNLGPRWKHIVSTARHKSDLQLSPTDSHCFLTTFFYQSQSVCTRTSSDFIFSLIVSFDPTLQQHVYSSFPM